MSDRTGYARGRLNPIIYFENSDGKIILPPDTQNARFVYETPGADGRSFKSQGFQWKEAGTLPEVDLLQRRLVEAEIQQNRTRADFEDRHYEHVWRSRGSDLYQRMISSSTSPFERDFLRVYLDGREEKRRKHHQRWTEATMYLDAREMDSNSKATDRIKS